MKKIEVNQDQKPAKQKDAKEKLAVFSEIDKAGKYSTLEKELIYEINLQVMSVDGTAEQWSYECNPVDYIETSIQIFELVKKHKNDIHA